MCMKKYGVDFERRNHAGLTAMECAVEVGREKRWQWVLEDVVETETIVAEAKNKKSVWYSKFTEQNTTDDS